MSPNPLSERFPYGLVFSLYKEPTLQSGMPSK
jgi:hypothetical protein